MPDGYSSTPPTGAAPGTTTRASTPLRGWSEISGATTEVSDPADGADHRTPHPGDPRAEGHRQRGAPRVPPTLGRARRARARQARTSRCRPTRFGSPSFPTTRSTRSASSAAGRRCSEVCARARGSMRPSTSPSTRPRHGYRRCTASACGPWPRWRGSRSGRGRRVGGRLPRPEHRGMGIGPRAARLGRTDARAAEPYRPHRGRVQLLLESSGIRAPAFGPRMEPRAIDRI